MHNWPRADYLQVQLGRVKNSISSAQALGASFLRGGLFLVNKEEMASRVTVIAGRGLWFVYTLQRRRAQLHRPEAEANTSQTERAVFGGRYAALAIRAGRKGRAPSEPPRLWGHGAIHASHRLVVLDLVVFHFLIITLLPHPKPNTGTLPCIYESPRRSIKVGAAFYSALLLILF
jgi:hypothetical protein